MKLFSTTLLSLIVSSAIASQALSTSPFAGIVAKRTTLPVVGINAEVSIPKVFPPVGQSGKDTFGGQILLGLDTINCSCSATVGIQFTTRKGRTQYRLFYQWLSEDLVLVKDVSVKAGDDLRLGIQGDEYLNKSPYNGTIYFTNYSNGQNTTINTTRKVPACAKNAVIVFERLGNYKLAKFSPAVLSDAYYVLNYGTFLHGNAVSDGTRSYNLTDAHGKQLVKTTINGPSMNFTYVA